MASLIQSIRRYQGLDFVSLDPNARATIQHLRRNLENALHNLSENLYSKSTHFIFELLQNADDNSYPQDAIPTLHIELNEQGMAIRCNEEGFGAVNVRAICSIGESTKQNQSGYIGEKGIGFKSVFTVADVVEVRSREYTFKFDKREELGMIAPIWIGTPAEYGFTSFHLTLSPDVNAQLLATHIDDIKPTLLLFLRRLRSIQLRISGRNRVFELRNLTPGFVRLEGTGLPSTEYLIVHYEARMAAEEKRNGISRSEVTIAFPMSTSRKPIIEAQDVHAFLPVQSFGLPFIVQGDFLTASSREGILIDRPWNITLRDAISPAFLRGVERFQQLPDLQFGWLQYIPMNISDGFIQPAQSSIIEELKRLPVFLCQDGARRVASSITILPAEYKNSNDAPLIPNNYIKKYYLSSRYDTSRDRAILQKLGIINMSFEEFMDGLQEMDGDGSLQKQNDMDWYNRVCSQLRLLRTRGYPDWLRRRISELQIIPLLANHQWVSSSAGNIFFNYQLGDIPQDLVIHLVGNHVSKDSSHYLLLRDLGVQDADVSNIAQQLLRLHSEPQMDSVHHPFLPSHARFLFRYKHYLTLPDQFPFWVRTTSGYASRATEVYMNHTRHQKPSLVQRLRSSKALFLHGDYEVDIPVTGPWQDFLLNSLKLNISPRIVNNALSPEFKDLLADSDTPTILSFLGQCWYDFGPKLEKSPGCLEQLRSIQVYASDSTYRRLDACFIGRKNLRSFSDLPFLPLEDPENKCWDFLGTLGVTFGVSSILYLNKLVALSEKYPVEVPSEEKELEVHECYQQLEARFEDNDDSGRIRTKFQERPLVYVPSSFASLPMDVANTHGRWLSLASVVWDGPRSMRSKFPLGRKECYPNLKKLFCRQLNVPICSEDILLQEMLLLVSECRDAPMSDDQHRQAHDILYDVNAVISKKPGPGNWVSRFRDVPAFPVQTAEGIKLVKFTDDFYVPDRTRKLARLFEADVPILTVPPSDSRGSLSRLLELFSSEQFKDVKHLEANVTRTVETVGERTPDTTCSDKFMERIPYIKQFLLHSTGIALAPRIESFVSKLEDVGIYEVNSINVSYSLGDATHDSVEELAIEADTNRCIVFVCGSCVEERRNMLFARRLAEHLPGVETDSICLILNFLSLDSIEEWLRGKGMAGEPQGTDLGSTSEAAWFTEARDNIPIPRNIGQSTGAPALLSTVKLDLAKLLGEYIPGIRNAAARQSISPTICDLGQLPTAFKNLVIEGVQSFENLSPENASTSSMQDIGMDTNHRNNLFAAGEGGESALTDDRSLDVVRLTIGRSAMRSRTGYNNSSAEQLVNGILGEIFVYLLFEKSLRGFDADNWTSRLRCHMPGLSPFNGSSLADFTYPDRFGDLTAKIFGEVQQDSWKGQWPTYHLEVKTTSGPFQVPFQINKHQMATAASMSIRDSTIPRDIYVLLRVYSIRSGPSLKMYSDPYRALHDGHLQIVSDVEMAITT